MFAQTVGVLSLPSPPLFRHARQSYCGYHLEPAIWGHLRDTPNGSTLDYSPELFVKKALTTRWRFGLRDGSRVNYSRSAGRGIEARKDELPGCRSTSN